MSFCAINDGLQECECSTSSVKIACHLGMWVLANLSRLHLAI